MKEMKYRVICPQCNRAFDCRQGILLDGKLVCQIAVKIIMNMFGHLIRRTIRIVRIQIQEI